MKSVAITVCPSCCLESVLVVSQLCCYCPYCGFRDMVAVPLRGDWCYVVSSREQMPSILDAFERRPLIIDKLEKIYDDCDMTFEQLLPVVSRR